MNQLKQLLIMLVVLFVGTGIINGQSTTNGGGTTISQGVVIGEDDEPIIGAAVVVDGTQNGTLTDIDGKFSLMTKPGDKLKITYIGYKPVVVAASADMKVVMTDQTNVLDEVVAIGYGTAKKKDLTGSVTQIRADNLANATPNGIQDLLRGVAGLNVGYSDGPTPGGSLQVRGQNSIGATSSTPLIILDGMIFPGDWTEINPDDIQQLDVLKDASAAAVYGAQAANGVIIITTKKGNLGAPVINFSANVGFVKRRAASKYLDADDYINAKLLWRESSTYGFDENGNYTTYQSGYENQPNYFTNPNNLPDNVSLEQWRGYTMQDGQSDQEIWLRRLNFNGVLLDNAMAGKVTDWESYVYRTGIRQDYNLSASGATDKAAYYLSVGYLDNQGTVKGSYFKTFRAMSKVSMDIASWLSIGATINFQERSNDSQAMGTGVRSNSPFGNAFDENGNPERYPNGTSGYSGDSADNTLWSYQYRDVLENAYTIFHTNAFVKIKLPFNITYQFNAAPRYQYNFDRRFMPIDVPTRVKPSDGGFNRGTSKNFAWTINNVVNWNKTFAKKHDVTVTLVQEAEEYRNWSESVSVRDIQPTDALGFHKAEGINKDYTTVNINDTHRTADALMARGQYIFDNRYLFSATVRRDGYCAFGANYPHATFSSFAGGWVFSNEDFWSDFNNVMNYGKLRLSYGTNGNRSLSDPYVSLADLSTGGNNRTLYYVNGDATQNVYMRVNRLANPNLRWEKTSAWNLGLDFGFINNRISGSVDLYYKKTSDMILGLRLPEFSGYSSITTNIGQVDNRGIELSIHSENMRERNFNWTTDFTFSYNKNAIKHVYGERDENGKEKDITSSGWFIGRPIGQIWSYKIEGVWQPNEADEAKIYGQQPGDPKVYNNPANDEYDADGNLVKVVYNDDDKVFLGQNNPPVRMTMNNNFRVFKNFEIGISMYSLLGYKGCRNWGDVNDVFLNDDNQGQRLTLTMRNQIEKPIWTPDNLIDNACRIGAQGPTGAKNPHYYVNRSFMRIDNISVAYNLPKNIINRFKVNELKVFFNVKNPCTIHSKAWNTKIYGDPETSGESNITYNLGLNLKL